MNWEMKKYPMYYGNVKQTYPNIAPGEVMCSESAVVGNLIFLSGMAGQTLETGKIQSDSLEEQMIVALDKIRIAMEEAGSSMNNIIKTLLLLKNLEDYPRMRKTELEYYQKYAPLLVEEPPASTFTQVTSLAKPEYLVEIDAIGVISRNEPGWEVKMYPMYYSGVKQVYPNVAPGSPIFSKLAVVGNLIFMSGMAGRSLDTGRVESDSMEEQELLAHDKIRMAMEEAGSSVENIIKTTHWVTDRDYVWPLWKTELGYYDKHAPFLIEEPPASTYIAVPSLADPKYKVEIEIITGLLEIIRAKLSQDD